MTALGYAGRALLFQRLSVSRFQRDYDTILSAGVASFIANANVISAAQGLI